LFLFWPEDIGHNGGMTRRNLSGFEHQSVDDFTTSASGGGGSSGPTATVIVAII